MIYEQAWLAYKKNENYSDKHFFKKVYFDTLNPQINNAIEELKLATGKIFGTTIKVTTDMETAGIVVRLKDQSFGNEGYRISASVEQIKIDACTSTGILYGVFHLLRLVQQNKQIAELNITEIPNNAIRMLNHWDNMSGLIERGYSGNSFFFKNGEIIINDRIKDYARLISSTGINAVSINNVNVYDAEKLITQEYLEQLKIIADTFTGYGIKMFISISFASPMTMGNLNTADPCIDEVKQWWKERAKLIYGIVPNLGGFLVKADSEGRPGPFYYNRTHSDGANMLARAVKEYGGTVIWRCFVYNCQQNWREYNKVDRARSSYDNFITLDGTFDENVILQIKNGPMDFQIREPINPLFGGLENTNQLLEVQIAQEYTGQQKHMCYLIPMFKEILEFETYCKSENSKVADIVSGKTFNQTSCGIVAVTNTGNDENWTGHDFAAANLYGFGRLTWNTKLSADEIAVEWIKQTFSNDEKIVHIILNMLMKSRETYEKYTTPLGLGWMVNPNHHYGPNPEGYEYDRWGTYHRADHYGIGLDRSSKGTGFSTLYKKENSEIYEHIDTCPEELLLFFHRINYTDKLKNGKTLIQYIYDTHFEGVEEVEEFKKSWLDLKSLIDKKVHSRVLARLDIQIEHSKEWRDVINSYFYRMSMIKDEKNRKFY